MDRPPRNTQDRDVDTRIALHAACVAQPDDNVRHLAYADWLDENGTSDADAARAEWIRLTCAKRRKSVVTRQAGERDWLTKNAPRLWPSLWDATGNAVRNGKPLHLFDWQRLRLSTGAFEFRVLVPYKTRRGASVVASQTVLRGRRGVIRTAHVTALRAAYTAPLVAQDEPLTALGFTGQDARTIPFCRVDLQYTRVLVDKKLLVSRGLLGVWNALEGWHDEREAYGGPQRVYSRDFHPDPIKTATGAVNAALTRWARGVAGVPHVTARPLIDVLEPDGPSMFPVAVPPRIGHPQP